LCKNERKVCVCVCMSEYLCVCGYVRACVNV